MNVRSVQPAAAAAALRFLVFWGGIATVAAGLSFGPLAEACLLPPPPPAAATTTATTMASASTPPEA